MNTQNYLYSQSKNLAQPTSYSVNFIDQPRPSQEQNKNNTNRNRSRNQPPYYTTNYFPSDEEDFVIKIISNFIQTKDLVHTIMTNQIFLNHAHEMNKYDNLEIIQHLKINVSFNHKIQSIHNLINQLKCITKSHCQLIPS